MLLGIYCPFSQIKVHILLFSLPSIKGEARQRFKEVDVDMDQLLQEIHQSQSTMYILNKKIIGQPIPAQDPLIDAKLVPIVADSTTIIQGIDPGIVATSTRSLFEAVNRLQAISDDQKVPNPKDKDHPFSLTVNVVNTAVMSHQDRKHREKQDINQKKRQQNAVKPKCRLKKYYQRKVTNDKAITP